MITIQPYIDKLEKLKLLMSIRIDRMAIRESHTVDTYTFKTVADYLNHIKENK